MYALILILGMNAQTVGTYSSLQDCQKNVQQFTQQDIKAACVRQQSPEEQVRMFEKFVKQLPKMVD